MRHLKPLLLLLALTVVCWASPVTYSNIPVTCKEFPPNIETETLTVTVDSALNGGTITAGSKATDDCYFNLAGNALSSPFTVGTYNYTSSLDDVCWHTGGFCVFGTSFMTLEIAPAVGGKLFTITASSITTTFTLPDTGTPPPPTGEVPEPASFVLLGSSLTTIGLFARRRRLG